MSNREQEVTAYERQREALNMRLAGESYDTIAERLGFASRSGAFRAVMSALKKSLREPADELRKLELTRLDEMTITMTMQAERGDQGAVDRLLRIMERRAKLLGLDAPTKIAPTDPTGEHEYAGVKDELLSRLARIADAGGPAGVYERPR